TELAGGGPPQRRHGGGGLDRHPLIAELGGTRLLDVARDAGHRPDQPLEHRGEQEQLGVRRQRRIHQHKPAQGGAVDRLPVHFGQAQREAGAHGKTGQEDLLGPAGERDQRGVHGRVPVGPPGVRHVLPGGAVPWQPRQADGQALPGQVFGPRPEGLRTAGEAMAEQHPDRPAGLLERFGAREYRGVQGVFSPWFNRGVQGVVSPWFKWLHARIVARLDRAAHSATWDDLDVLYWLLKVIFTVLRI